MATKGSQLLRRKGYSTVLLFGLTVCVIALLFKNETGGELFFWIAKTDRQGQMEQMEKHMKIMEHEIGTLRKR